MIISYEMFLRSVEDVKKIKFGLVICDEAHRLKNTTIKTTTVSCVPNRKKAVFVEKRKTMEEKPVLHIKSGVLDLPFPLNAKNEEHQSSSCICGLNHVVWKATEQSFRLVLFVLWYSLCGTTFLLCSSIKCSITIL